MSLKKLATKVKKENKAKDMPLADRIAKSMDNFIVSGKANPPRQSRKAFNPSGYYKCMRQLFYKLNDVPEKRNTTARSQRILEVGTALHEWVQREVLMKMNEFADEPIKLVPKTELPAYGQEGFELVEHKVDRAVISLDKVEQVTIYNIHETYTSIPATEVKFLDYRWTEVFPVSAMVDGYFSYEGEELLFEFKTINPTDYDTLIEPLVDHVKQGAIYATCTGVRRVMFLYLCKGTQNWKPYIVEYTDAQIEWVKNRIQTIEGYVLRKELPPKEESTLHCRYCAYKSICEKELTGLGEDSKESTTS